MNSKIIVAFVLVAFAAAAQSKLVIKKDAKPKQLDSADVESLLDPTVQSLPNGQHKLVFKGASGQEQCVVCQPFQGCGCRDVVAIRCELKRLKQKLLRLKRIAHPHARSHHGRDEDKKPAIKPLIQVKRAVQPAPKPAVQPAVLVKPAVLVAEKK